MRWYLKPRPGLYGVVPTVPGATFLAAPSPEPGPPVDSTQHSGMGCLGGGQGFQSTPGTALWKGRKGGMCPGSLGEASQDTSEGWYFGEKADGKAE